LVLAAAVFVLFFVFGIAAFVVLVVALPARYFLDGHGPWAGNHPLIRLLGLIGKNLLGLLLIALGVVLSIPGVPGQGLLTILIGLMLLDIPGKHRIVKRFVRRPGVLRTLNGLRAWFGRQPLVV
jgi:hypothetical protein